MARNIASRIYVTGVLEAIDPLHVGSGREDSESDLALAVDGQGRLYAPGSSLAGPLRHWSERAFGKAETDRAFGFQDQTNPDNGHASYLLVEDAPIHVDGRPVEIRDGVGIDRRWGTAAPRVKFDRAVLQPGTTLALALTLELPPDDPGARTILGHLLTRLQNKRLRLGAAKTRGLGRVQLKELRWHERANSRDGLIRRLKGDETTSSDAAGMAAGAAGPRPKVLDTLGISIGWRPVLPTFVKAGIDGLRVDIVPLLGGTAAADYTPVIPGSSFKGAIRNHAERILRTVLERDLPDRNDNPSQQFLRQLNDSKLPLVRALFGARKDRQVKGRLGALSVADCFAQNPKPLRDWNDLLFQTAAADDVQEATAFPAALARVNRADWQKAFHVAIDRWTGGAAESMLYQVLEPYEECWPAFALELDLTRLDDDEDRKASLALLLLTLRDLAHERIPIGFGGNRGLGAIEVSTITLAPIEGAPFGISESLSLPEGRLSALGEPLQTELRNAWTRVLEASK